MTLIARSQYLCRRHSDAAPPRATLPEALYRQLTGVAFLHMSRHQMGYRLAVARDGNGLAALDHAQKVCKTCLGLGGLDLFHGNIKPVNITG